MLFRSLALAAGDDGLAFVAWNDARLALAQALAAQEVAMATRDEDLAAAIEAEVAGGGP